VLLTPNEKRVAEDRRDCYWLYIVTDCKSAALLQNPIKDPARFEWHEVKKVEHYYLSVEAVTRPTDFMFQLGKEEFASLRSQIVTSKRKSARGGRRYPPYAFTEEGVAMLSSVLNSPNCGSRGWEPVI